MREYTRTEEITSEGALSALEDATRDVHGIACSLNAAASFAEQGVIIEPDELNMLSDLAHSAYELMRQYCEAERLQRKGAGE